ncbi:hypothetical protein FHG87_017219, partial [Trinorchestia longiramus]
RLDECSPNTGDGVEPNNPLSFNHFLKSLCLQRGTCKIFFCGIF